MEYSAEFVSVTAVRSAIHVRSGSRAAVERVDAWLARQRVAVVPLADAYDACVHLLQHYADVPDLALVGADALTADELHIVRYIRHTWPRTGIVVYGGLTPSPLLELVPLLETFAEPMLDALTRGTPNDVLDRMLRRLPAIPAAQSEPAARAMDAAAVATSPPPAEGPRRAAAGVTSPRLLLTPEELAALLGSPERE